MIIKRVEWDGLDAPRMAAEVRSFGPTLSEVSGDVQRILRAVATRGDEGVREVAEHYGDDVPDDLRVDPEAIEAAPGMIDAGVREALETAAKNIVEVARAEMGAPGGAVIDMPDGQRIEIREDPVPRAGVYAPGGRAAYPSSVLMCAIPALVAGVGRLAVVTPPGVGGRPNPVVLTACKILNLTEVYAIGGAQAIGALAFGTETVPRVDVIAGPGNRFVTAAKRIVAGRVGIDGVAGPSELAIVADGVADPWALALDLCAQAEHGEDSPLLIVSPDARLLDLVEQNVIEIAQSRPSVTEACLAIVKSTGIQAALDLVDAFAPEHLQLAFDGVDEISARARLAGCIFLGAGGATAFGDYAAGSNHVLPTGGATRYGGPLGPGTFMRRTSIVTIPSAAARALAPTVNTIARAEGLPVHGESARYRAGENV